MVMEPVKFTLAANTSYETILVKPSARGLEDVVIFIFLLELVLAVM